MNNMLRVLFFAGIKEKTQQNQLFLDVPANLSVYDLRLIVAEMFPVAREEIMHSLASMNKEYASNDEKLENGAEIAFFPRVSGGSDIKILPTLCRIQDDEIMINEALNHIITPSSGAIGMFTGVVRNITHRGDIQQTDYLIYEAYLPMAENKMLQITQEIRKQWLEIEGIALVQRIGRVDPGALSVLVACAAPHRNSGVFEAAKYGIDRLKQIVPIWKQESGFDGQVWVEGEYWPKPNE